MLRRFEAIGCIHPSLGWVYSPNRAILSQLTTSASVEGFSLGREAIFASFSRTSEASCGACGAFKAAITAALANATIPAADQAKIDAAISTLRGTVATAAQTTATAQTTAADAMDGIDESKP